MTINIQFKDVDGSEIILNYKKYENGHFKGTGCTPMCLSSFIRSAVEEYVKNRGYNLEDER